MNSKSLSKSQFRHHSWLFDTRQGCCNSLYTFTCSQDGPNVSTGFFKEFWTSVLSRSHACIVALFSLSPIVATHKRSKNASRRNVGSYLGQYNTLLCYYAGRSAATLHILHMCCCFYCSLMPWFKIQILKKIDLKKCPPIFLFFLFFLSVWEILIPLGTNNFRMPQ